MIFGVSLYFFVVVLLEVLDSRLVYGFESLDPLVCSVYYMADLHLYFLRTNFHLKILITRSM
jgi:hypothetical protein